MVNLSLGAPRFPSIASNGKESKVSHLGPGSYPNAAKSIKPPIMIGSPFQSNSVRFKPKKHINDIAPGSYDIASQSPVKSVWKPFVVTLQSKLSRTMVLVVDVISYLMFSFIHEIGGT